MEDADTLLVVDGQHGIGNRYMGDFVERSTSALRVSSNMHGDSLEERWYRLQ